MEKLSAVRKIGFSLILSAIGFAVFAQEKNLAQETDENFRLHYKVGLYEQFPTFPKYIGTGNKTADDKDFEKRGWDWVAANPEYREFIIKQLDRQAVQFQAGAGASPATPSTGSRGIQKIQK